MIHGLVTKMILWKSLCLYNRLLRNSCVVNGVIHTLNISIKKVEGRQKQTLGSGALRCVLPGVLILDVNSGGRVWAGVALSTVCLLLRVGA